MTRATFLSLFALSLLILPACRDKDEPPLPSAAPGPYVIGIFQSVDSPTANEVRRGILQAFAEAGLRDGQEIVVTIRIANNDIAEVQRIARDLAAGDADMIIPLSTQALQAAILATRRKPIVFGAVAVPYLVGAGTSAENHLGHVTGVVSTGPVRETMALIREVLPKARRVGSLWTSSEINSEHYLDLAREAAGELGFELVAVPVTGPHEIPRRAPAPAQRKGRRALPDVRQHAQQLVRRHRPGGRGERGCPSSAASSARSSSAPARPSATISTRWGSRRAGWPSASRTAKAPPGSRSSPWTRSGSTSIRRPRPSRGSSCRKSVLDRAASAVSFTPPAAGARGPVLD